MRSPVISNTAVHLDIFLIDDPLKEWGLRVLADWLMVHSVTGLVWCEVSPVPGLCQYFSFFILSHLAPKLSSQNDTQRISRRTFDRSGERWGEVGPGSGPGTANTGHTVGPVRQPQQSGRAEVERRGEKGELASSARPARQRLDWGGGGVGTCQSLVCWSLPSQWQPAQLILHPSLLPGLARASPAQPPGEMDNARLGKTTKDWLSRLTIGDSSSGNSKLKLVLTLCLLLTLLSPSERKSQMSGSGDISRDK